MITILNKIVKYIVHYESCTACKGTGGSFGNTDPSKDWTCGTCHGRGYV